MRPVTLFGLSALTLCLFLTTGAKADPMATQAFGNLDMTTADGSATGNINTATTVMIGAWTSTTVDSGALTGMPMQTFAPFTFTTTSPTSLTFGNSVFGTFTSTSITETTSPSGFLNLNVLGNWTPGTFGGVTGGPFASQLALTLSQTPPTNGAISASGTFSIPVPGSTGPGPGSTTPEPSTIFMVLMGLAAAVVGSRLRRRRRGVVAS